MTYYITVLSWVYSYVIYGLIFFFFVIILLLTIVYAFSQVLTDFTSDFLPGLYLKINNVSGQHELF